MFSTHYTCTMAQQDSLDFSGLFKLDVLVHLDILTHSFYELGLRKFLALSSDKDLVFVYIDSQGEKFDYDYYWDFIDNPIYCMCFEPTGTWVVIVSDQKILLVPFLPLFTPQNTFDFKWSLSSVTVLPLTIIPKPTSMVFWLTKDSDNVLIIGSKNGVIIFYMLETQTISGECKISSEIIDLQICYDDSLDLLTLLITGTKYQQWKLVLEHRSVGYNWLQQSKLQTDKDKKDGFMSYIKQLSKDKITLFIQGGSKDEHKSTVEYVLKPTEYLPLFRKGSNNWALTAQYVNGRHFLSAFELNEGTLILESPEEETPSRTLRPRIKKDGQYIQGLWSQRLIYLVRKNEIEVHSASFSVIQGEGAPGAKREFSELWACEVIGEVRRAYLMSAKEAPATSGGWREPTFMCDLQLPRFNLESCLVITSCGAYILNNVCEPCTWLVGLITRGGGGAEQSAAALGAPVPALLRAAADLLLSRGKVAPAHYLYALSQSQPDGWIARLGVFGRLEELTTFKLTGNIGSLGTAATTIKLLALMLKMATNNGVNFETDVKLVNLTPVELLELSSIAAAIGLWDLVPVFTIHRGHPNLMLAAIKSRKELCRGAIYSLLQQKCLVPYLVDENVQWLLDFVKEKCNSFDTELLKRFCLWLNPLQDELRPVMRDLKQRITSIYTARLQLLITTFVEVASAIEARNPCPEIHLEITQTSETWKNTFTSKRTLSCGLAHWAVVDDGNAKIMMANTYINTDLIGRVVDIACGRHHTIVLTENGIYTAGDNSYGQLGVGSMWAGAIGDAATPSGALLHVPQQWTAPLVCVAAGHYHSAAVDAGGRLFTWGWNVHGQLGLGSIDDHCTPQLVTKLQGRKVISVSCGACHTVALSRSGEVWCWGAGAFGQLGHNDRHKASLPLLLKLPETVVSIAAGYFHNLALTSSGSLWCWGGSPQQVRAAAARQAASPSPHTAPDSHLAPHAVDITNVKGRVVKMAAGWHHSCIVDNFGSIYTWGLNFDGQLGSGDRKQILLPTEMRLHNEALPEGKAKTSEVENKDETTKALIACGGDFTIYIDDDGRIYATGNMHLPVSDEKEKGASRVIMMKTTKRVIKIPASRSNNRFLFQPIDRLDIMFPFDIDGLQRLPIEPRRNPLVTMEDFENKTWPDDIILLLKPWIYEPNLTNNLNMAAKLAYHNRQYTDCLKSLLDHLKSKPIDEQLYVTHTKVNDHEQFNADKTQNQKTDELKIKIKNVMSKRMKDISMSILNEDAYPIIEQSTYQALPCCCGETKYVSEGSSKSVIKIKEPQDLAIKAAKIIDTCISMFPIDTSLWESSFRLSKDFFLENNLSVAELEAVLRKYMESNATTMAAAIMYSNDCTQYSKILTPKFYLNMCSQVLDTWG